MEYLIIFILLLLLVILIFIIYNYINTKNNEYFIDTDNIEITKKKKIKCKYFPSYSKGYVCPEKYGNHLGATFGAKNSSGLLCNGKKIKSNPAKAYCIIKNKSISNIKLIDKGLGYIKQPKIKIIGKGINAEAKAILDKYGSIEKIEIINAGQNYIETPKIKIEKPNGYTYCHLCCQL